MEQIVKERDRLLQRTARTFGLGFGAVSLVCLSIPNAVSLSSYLIALALYLVMGFALYGMGVSRHIGWVLVTILSGTASGDY